MTIYERYLTWADRNTQLWHYACLWVVVTVGVFAGHVAFAAAVMAGLWWRS